MRILIHIIIFFFLFTIGYAQDINGKWIKVKAEMKDGSRILDGFDEDTAYAEYTITKTELCLNYSAVHKNNEACLPYKRQGDILKTGESSSYVIEKVSVDSLTLYENFNGYSNDKLKRIYFARKEHIITIAKEKNKDKDHVLATSFFTPTISKSLEEDIHKAFQKRYINFDISGSLFFYPQENRVEAKIVSNSSEDNASEIKTIQKIVEESFKKWDLKNFADYKSVELPFVLRSQISKRVRGISIEYFTNNIQKLNTMYGPKLEDIRKSGELFDEGIKAYGLKKYKEAIMFFEEAYMVNPKNIDALYNVASLHYESGDKENACKTWSKLSDLGQVQGMKLHKKHCQ